MALHLVIRMSNRPNSKQRVLLATEDRAYAKTKFDLEAIKGTAGSVLLAKVTKFKVIDRVVSRKS